MNEIKLRNYAKRRMANLEPFLVGKRYYRNDTDIRMRGVVPRSECSSNPLRNADNRIAHNFHQILVDEKASYLFTYPPSIDVDDNDAINDTVIEALGQSFGRKIKDLSVEASNTGKAWVHYWIDQENRFRYDKIASEQVIPFYSDDLEKKLIEVLRVYIITEYDDNLTAKEYYVVEDWTETTFDKYIFETSIDGNDISEEKGIIHNFGRVPFIKFANNEEETSDLIKYKDLIDLYDRVMSGYANDIEDIQQTIWLISNYGGTDLTEFMQNLKIYKAVEFEDDGDGAKGGVETLSIDIPVEARNSILEILKKQIYESGQGLQQDVESVGNASGTALKFFYRKLELKAGLLETEFRESINELVEAILRHFNMAYDKINQTWTRNMISSDLESAQIAQQSVGIIPEKMILQNHPWVDDVVEAERLLEEEEQKKNEMFNSYSNMPQAGEEVLLDEE